MEMVISYFGEHALKAAQIQWIEETVQPDIYAVCTLKQSFGIMGDKGPVFTKGDRYRYERLCEQFHKRLSKEIVGAKRWRKSKTRIPLAATLENKGASGEFHLNFYARRPHWMSFEEFRDAFLGVWFDIEWSRPNTYFKKRTGKCVIYGHKEGSATLLVF